MAITYSAPNGTRITTAAMDEVCVNQSQQTGNNTIVVSGLPLTVGNGNIGSGTNGIGNGYVGRLCILNIGTGSEQVRRCTGSSAGTGGTYILTVDDDWDTNPVATTDHVYFPYDFGDIEDGGSGGGVNLNSKSGLWEFSNTIEVQSTGILQCLEGQGMELDDQGSTYAFQVQSGGYFYGGYETATGIRRIGMQMIMYNNAVGEPSMEVLSGGYAKIVDSLIWAQLVKQKFDVQDGATAVFKRCKFLSVSEELILYNSDITDCSAEGRVPNTTELVRVDADTVCNGFTLSTVYGLDSRADTVTETIELWAVVYDANRYNIRVRNNKTWNMVDTVWDVVSHTDLNWVGSTNNRVNDRRSVTAIVKEADGTLLQNALVNIYENTQTADLVLELTTDVNGYAQGTFIYREMITNSTTNTFGGHALQSGKWLYRPFVSSQVSSQKFDGIVTLASDPNIVQTTQATAKSAGSTITWNEDTNPSELFGFDTGSGTLAVGMILTFSGGAVGTITESKDGDSVSGQLHLKDRNATAIGATDTFSRTGGTAGTFSGTCNAAVNPVQPFSIWIDAQSLGYQATYDYLAAIQNETTLTADGELIWEWCRSSQSQPLYATGSSFFTERSNGKGIIIVDGGAGTLDYATDDAGTTWVPPVTYSFKFTLSPSITGYEWRLYEASGTPGDGTIGTVELAGEEVASADNQTYVYQYTADQDIAVQILANGYEEFLHYDTLTNSNKDLTFNLVPETNT